MATLTDKNTDRITIISIPEAGGIIATFKALQSVLYDLRAAGSCRHCISLLKACCA